MSHARSPLRQRIDQQRVLLWYRWIHDASHGATCYALEKRLMPEGFARTAQGAWSHRNRMAQYAQGKHVPRPDLVKRAEGIFPGSQALLEHAYWQIIDAGFDLLEHRRSWVDGLGAEVRRILYQPTQRASDLVAKRRRTTRLPLRQLENLGTFEALAATALLLREAQAENNDSLAFDCARSYWVILLLIVSTLPFIHILYAMAELAGSALLDHVRYQGEQVAIAAAPIGNYERYLRHYCLASEDREQLGPSRSEWVALRLKLMRGIKGLDLLYVFQLPVIATPELRADPKRYILFQREQFVRLKALDYSTDARWAKRSLLKDFIAYESDPEGRWPTLD